MNRDRSFHKEPHCHAVCSQSSGQPPQGRSPAKGLSNLLLHAGFIFHERFSLAWADVEELQMPEFSCDLSPDL